jgi:immune inhibitor A
VKIVALIALVAILLSGRSAPAETLDAWQTLEVVTAANPPVRDPADLRSRIQSPPGTGQGIPQPLENTVWVNDLVDHTYRLATVDLAHASEHGDWLVERGTPAGDLTAAADYFEERLFPTVTQLTGVSWTPGSAGSPKLAIFNGHLRGAAGYMTAADAQPRSVFPYSNERPVVYLNTQTSRPGSPGYNATLAHELEHLAHFLVNPVQVGWFDEGLAELVSHLVRESPPPTHPRFREKSDVQLTAWSEQPGDARPHYEASYLWSQYLMERGGGAGSLADLIGVGGQGLVTADRFARTRGLDGGVNGLFREWLVANLVDNAAVGDGRFGYRGLDQRSGLADRLYVDGDTIEDTVHQFAGRYYELALEGAAELWIEVGLTVPLIGAGDVRGPFFWSLRGDNLDTRLTRRFDLSQTDQATLRYRVWHDLERDYDVCYTLGSSDGMSWLTLAGRWTTDRDNLGQVLGPGYTGSSGTGWLDEEIDLSPFAGGPAYIRFECVTDQSYSAPGFAVDDVEIPEIGFSDSADFDQDWSFEGFVRVINAMAQPATVMIVEESDSGLNVWEVPLDVAGRGRVSLGGPTHGAHWTAAIVTGLAPATLEKMAYRLSLAPVS